jgi:hypothetical protein
MSLATVMGLINNTALLLALGLLYDSFRFQDIGNGISGQKNLAARATATIRAAVL